MSLHAPRTRRGGLPPLIKMAAVAAAICMGLWSAAAAGQAAAAGGRHHRGRHHRNHRRHRGVHTARHALAHASSASAPCTVFVSASGDASSTGGSAGSPTSFSAALARVGPGSVVCLQAGSYDIGSNVVLSRSGSASSPIIYRSFGGTTLLRYTGGSLDGGLLQTSRGNNWGGAHDIVIEGLTIDGAEKIGGGIFVSGGSHHITIQNCVIRNTGSAGIEVNAADYVTVTHNVVYRAGYNQGWSSGIDLWYGGSNASYGGASAWYDRANAFHNVIADNIVAGSYDNSSNHSDGNGIIVDGSGSIPPAL